MKKYDFTVFEEKDFFMIIVENLEKFYFFSDIELLEKFGFSEKNLFNFIFFDKSGNNFTYFFDGKVEIICKNKEEFEKILKSLRDYDLNFIF